jgi:ferrous iron transport protein A
MIRSAAPSLSCPGQSTIAKHSHLEPATVTLSQLSKGACATVTGVEDRGPGDQLARRLRALGFVGGEAVRVVSVAPMGGDPLLVQVGYTRFALRRNEAERIRVEKVPA